MKNVLVKPPLRYDGLVQQSPQGSIFAYRWWLDAVIPDGYEIAEVRKGGLLVAAWPVTFVMNDGVKSFCMPPLTQKLGILFAPSDAKPSEVQSSRQKIAGELLEGLGDAARFHQNFHENFTDWLPFFWKGYSQTTRYTYVLENISDTDAVWNGMRTKHRNVIRKAQKLGILVKEGLELERFLELNRMTFSRQGLSPLASDEQIRRLDKACCANADRKIFYAEDSGGKLHAAVYIAWADDTAYYLMGGSDPELRQSGAQMAVLWEAIVSVSSVVKRFDFEGSVLRHVEPVCRGFGAKQLPYFSISQMPVPPSSLRGMLKASIKFRWSRAMRVVAGGWRK